jgi:hypothetical protein
MERIAPAITPLEPPADVPEIQRGSWYSVPDTDPVVTYLVANLWNQEERPVSWSAARLSNAAYVYQESRTGWSVVGKFYAVKTGDTAQRYAEKEFAATRQVEGMELEGGRPVRPLAVWRGILFLEYVDGLSLEDVIAVRRSRPGRLIPDLEQMARFLASLHVQGKRPDVQPEFEPWASYARGLVDELEKYGVLQDDPLVGTGLVRLIDLRAQSESLRTFQPAVVHGDATTGNFIFPWGGGEMVAVDWERLRVTDPASDLGRLLAELAHSIHQHGGSMSEALPFVQKAADAYVEGLPPGADRESLAERTRFYRALSTLRIARNGWVSRLDRTALVAQALALLA